MLAKLEQIEYFHSFGGLGQGGGTFDQVQARTISTQPSGKEAGIFDQVESCNRADQVIQS